MRESDHMTDMTPQEGENTEGRQAETIQRRTQVSSSTYPASHEESGKQISKRSWRSMEESLTRMSSETLSRKNAEDSASLPLRIKRIARKLLKD